MNRAIALGTSQNEPHFIRLLAAISQFYSYGKIALGFQLFLTIGLAIILTTITIYNPSFKGVATFVAITVLWIDVVFIDRIQVYFRRRGAVAQEQFDCELFKIDPNELRCGKPIDVEDIHCAAERFLKTTGDSKLKNWYPTDADGLPSLYVTLICQRVSIWWDKTQRRVLSHWLIGIAVFGLVAVGLLGIVNAQHFKDILLTTYASIAPAIVWCFREARRQMDAASSLEKTRAFVDGVWQKALADSIDEAKLQVLVRQIQDAMFENRSKNPLLFNWIYGILRDRRETVMHATAKDYAKEVRDKLAGAK